MMNKLRNHMKTIMAVIAIAFLFSTFLMYEGRSRGPRRNADGTMSDYEVAKVNGRVLMRSDLDRRVRAYLENLDQRSAASLDIQAIYQTALEQYVFEQQMEQEVKAQGIQVSDQDAERVMKNYADLYFPTREAFYQSLERSGISVENYKASIARQLANERVLQNAIGTVEVSEDQAVMFYDTMRNLLYRQPSGYTVNLADFNSNTDAEKFRDVLESGTDWATIISDDMIKTLSLDLVDITPSPMFIPDSAFTGKLAVLASLDIGQVSPVFELNSDDFAIGVKAEYVPEKTQSYDDVSNDIRVLLRQQEERSRLMEFQNELLNKANTEIYDPELFPALTSADTTAQ